MYHEKVTFTNYATLLYHGARLAYDGYVGDVEEDETWSGGFKIAGRSILQILESCDDVFLL